MRKFAMVYPQFWLGRTGNLIMEESQDVQILTFYLLTNPHANMLGIYACPMRYLSADLRIPKERVQVALQTLKKLRFAEYDFKAEVVWVYRFAHYQLGELKASDNKCKGCSKMLFALPLSYLIARFHTEYASTLHLSDLSPHYIEEIETETGNGHGNGDGDIDMDMEPSRDPPKGLARGFEGASTSVSPLPENQDDIQPVIDTWNEEMTHRAAEKNGAPHKPKRFGPLSKEWEEVRRRLSEGYSVEELQNAVRGMFKNEFNNGKNATGRQYLSLLVAMRSSNVSDFANQTQGKPLLDDEFMEFMRK